MKSVAILSQLFVADFGSWLHADGAAEPTPSPTEVLRPGLDKWDVTPGLLGFIAMFCIVLAAVAVWFSMSGKLRKIQYDERMEASAAEARADGDQAAADSGQQEFDAGDLDAGDAVQETATSSDTDAKPDAPDAPDQRDDDDPAAGSTSDRNPDGV